MKTKLLFTFLISFFTVGIQSAFAQYSGVAYNGVTPQLGATVGVAVKIEFENYDALSGDASGDGANFGVNTDFNTLPSGATYYDGTAGGDANQSMRLTSDVDIIADGSGNALTSTQGNENLVYTVNVVNAGTYHLNVNYNHNGSSKNIKVYSYNADGTGKTLLYDGLSEDLPPTGGVYVTTSNLGSFTLPAGPLLIKFRTLDAGPKFDYMTFTLDATLGVDDLGKKANTLKAYPNPAKDGQFKINVDSDWKVYSLLGVQLLEGEGEVVDLSSFSKGIYVLKTPYASKKLVYN